MKDITSTQRSYLRKMAHHLKPVVQVGKQGLTEAVVHKIDQELDAHELIKVKFADASDQKQIFAEDMANRSASILVAMIGNIAILYREQRDLDRRVIILPAS